MAIHFNGCLFIDEHEAMVIKAMNKAISSNFKRILIPSLFKYATFMTFRFRSFDLDQ